MISKTLKIKTSKEIIDKAFRRAKQVKTDPFLKTKLDKEKHKHSNKISTIQNIIKDELTNIIHTFPLYEKLTPFYKELFDSYVDIKKYKKCMQEINWAKKKINELSSKSIAKIKNHRKIEDILKTSNEYYGRVSSILKDIDECLKYLIEVKSKLKRFPEIPENLYIFVLAGYPNVGKSSLIKALSKAKVETQPYPFTTKDLNLGIIDNSIALIDTPGLLDRDIEQMNEIEKKGLSAIKHLSETLIAVIDPSLSSGYELEKQISLLKKIISQYQPKSVIAVITKTDLINQEELPKIKQTISKELGLPLEAIYEFSINNSHLQEKLKNKLMNIALKNLSHKTKSFRKKV